MQPATQVASVCNRCCQAQMHKDQALTRRLTLRHAWSLQDPDDENAEDESTVQALLTAYRAQKQAKQHRLEVEAAQEGRSFSAPAASPGSDAIRKRTAGDQLLKQAHQPEMQQRVEYRPATSVEERRHRPERSKRPGHGSRPKPAGRISADRSVLPVVPEEPQSRADSIKHDPSSSVPCQHAGAHPPFWAVHNNASFTEAQNNDDVLAPTQPSEDQRGKAVPHHSHHFINPVQASLEAYVASGHLPPGCPASAIATFLEHVMHVGRASTMLMLADTLKRLWQDTSVLVASDRHMLLAHQLVGATTFLDGLTAAHGMGYNSTIGTRARLLQQAP